MCLRFLNDRGVMSIAAGPRSVSKTRRRGQGAWGIRSSSSLRRLCKPRSILDRWQRCALRAHRGNQHYNPGMFFRKAGIYC
jgi:hypothetical protein